MRFSDIIDTKLLYQNGIIPVVCLTNDDELETFSNSIEETKLSCVEITFRHPYAPTAVKKLKARFHGITVGAGTILTEELLETAVKAGADFLVSPGTSLNLIEKANTKGLPFLPGCSTPSEIQLAYENGFDTVKFFPAEISGGTSALRLYEGAFAGMMFIPTGGITMDNLSSYLGCKNVLACGGSFMASKDDIKSGKSDEITRKINTCTNIRMGMYI